MSKILVTGGSGYVGSRLTPFLLEKGHHVRVLDALIYTSNGLDALKKHPNFPQWQERFEFIQDDIRNAEVLEKALTGVDAVIHLAALSSDPVCEIDEILTRQVNFEAVGLLLYLSRQKGVRRFINASTSSVLGLKHEEKVTEQLEPEPVTLYSKYKMLGEWLVFTAASNELCTVNIRPATICGYSPRQRFDLTVNKLTADAFTKRRMVIHAGQPHRPTVTMTDMINLYAMLLDVDAPLINGKTFNFGFENYKIADIAKLVQNQLKDLRVDIQVMESTDNRDFHISSEKILHDLGYKPISTIEQEVQNLRRAFEANQFANIESPEYYNLRSIKISRMPSCSYLFSH